MTLAEEPLPLIAGYERAAACYDEAIADDGSIRPAAEGAMRALDGHDLEALAVSVERQGADEGVVFHSSDGDEVFVIDPVPRVIAAAEWSDVEAGLAQRVRALNAFVADVYGERRIVAEGVVPARVIDGAEYYEPEMRGRAAAGRPVDRHRRPRPGARRRRPLPGARGQRAHPERLRLRRGGAARAGRAPRRSRPATRRARSTTCRRC